MRLSTILKIVAVLIVAVIVGGIVVVMNIDFNQYKDLIATKVKEATGRSLVIEGDIELELSLTPTLAVSGVRFQNAEWGSKPQMLTVERFSAQVSLLPLLSKTVEVQHVLLSGADILIERDAKGRANFDFEGGAKDTASTSGSGGAVKPDTGASAPSHDGLPIPVVRKVLVENATITYRDAVAGQQKVLKLDKLSLSGEGPDEPVDLTFALSLNGEEVSGTGQLGPLAGLTDPDTAWPLTLKISAAQAEVSVQGQIQDLFQVKGLGLKLGLAGPSFATFSKLAGAAIPPIGPYTIGADLKGDLAGTIRLENLAVKIGKSDVGGKAALRLGGARPAIDGSFTSNLLDLDDFTKADAPASAGTTGPASGGDSGGGQKAATDGRVIPDTPLPLDALKLADAKLGFNGKRILAQGVAVENVAVTVVLQNGLLAVAPFKAEVAKGTLDGSVTLDARTATPALTTSVKALRIDFGKLLGDADITDLLEGSVNANVQLSSRGKTPRALASALDGDVKVVMGEGRVKTTALDAFIGGPTQVVAKMITGDKKEYTVLNCVVSQTGFERGLATLKAAVIDTEYARITGKGTVNLANEALAVVVNPEPKSATLNLAVAVKVGGTLGDPSYGLDELSVLRKLGGTVLGIGFPPALILGLGELGADAESPCLKSGKKPAEAKPDSGESASEGVTKGVADAVKGVSEGAGKLLKGLFGK